MHRFRLVAMQASKARWIHAENETYPLRDHIVLRKKQTLATSRTLYSIVSGELPNSAAISCGPTKELDATAELSKISVSEAPNPPFVPLLDISSVETYVCMYVCMYVGFMDVCMYVCMYVCMRALCILFMLASKPTCIHRHVHRIHVHVHV